MLMTLFCATAQAQEDGTLLLVREWHTDTGTLTAWLPEHQVMVFLQLADTKGAPAFDPDEAVYARWINAEGIKHSVVVAPRPRLIDGHEYLPVERDANLVRIKKHIFFLREITFGGNSHDTSMASR